MQQAERHERDTGEQRIRAQQVGEVAGVLLVGADRYPVQEITQSHTDEKGRDQTATGQRNVPAAAPAGRVMLVAELQRQPAADERDQQQHECGVETGEHRRIPGWEGREHSGCCDDQPDLVGIPDRPDGGERDPSAGLIPAGVIPAGLVLAGLVLADDSGEHADAEVEALQHEKSCPQYRDNDEPEGGQRHGGLSIRRRPWPDRRRSRVREWVGVPVLDVRSAASGSRRRPRERRIEGRTR